MKARVIGIQEATSTTQPVLILTISKYWFRFSNIIFQDGENISANVAITHDTGYGIDIASATTFAKGTSQTGS